MKSHKNSNYQTAGSLLSIALSQYGVKEIPGETHHPSILSYFKETGHEQIMNDETAWCSAFVNWVALKAGAQTSGRLDARSWLKVGHEVQTPQQGDVVIFWREDPSGWKGHVGFFVNYTQDGRHIHCLGGNQGNTVDIRPYPKAKVLGFRRLSNSHLTN